MRGLIWQIATVVEARDDLVRVSFDPLTNCQRCLQGDGCGAGVFTRLFSRRAASLVLRRDHDFEVGERLRVGITGTSLVLAASALYGFPLLGFLAGALTGHWLAGDAAARDLMALLFGLTAGLATFGLFRPGPNVRLNPHLQRLSCTKSDSALESGVE